MTLLSVTVAAGWLWWDHGARHPDIWIVGISGEAEVRLPIENYRVLMTGTAYTFDPIIPDSEVWQVVRSNYPNAEIQDSTARIFHNNQYVTITPAAGGNGSYTLALEHVVVWDGADSYSVPFPVTTINGDYSIENEGPDGHVPTDCGTSCLTDYYRPFTNVTLDGDTVTVTLPATTTDPHGTVVSITSVPGEARVEIHP